MKSTPLIIIKLPKLKTRKKHIRIKSSQHISIYNIWSYIIIISRLALIINHIIIAALHDVIAPSDEIKCQNLTQTINKRMDLRCVASSESPAALMMASCGDTQTLEDTHAGVDFKPISKPDKCEA